MSVNFVKNKMFDKHYQSSHSQEKPKIRTAERSTVRGRRIYTRKDRKRIDYIRPVTNVVDSINIVKT